MLIGALQKTTLVDFPGKIACVVFTVGCNFNCGYCHNPELSNKHKANETIHDVDFFEFLLSRRGKLEGVCITGGEPTLQPDLIEFIKKIKKLGFDVKLDTQGSSPTVVKELMDRKLVDYIAMDIKAPFESYTKVSKSNVSIDKIKESISIIMSGKVSYEFRTTVVKEQLSVKDIQTISESIKGAKRYCLQKFKPTKTKDPEFLNKTTYSNEEFDKILSLIQENFKECLVR